MTPLCPVESWCTSDPCITQVTISMSRCGWVSKPVPGSTTSSLLTSSSPWWVLAGSWCEPNENECLLSSHEMRVAKRSSAWRTSTRGLRVGVVMSGPPGAGGRASGACGSGVLDRGDLELEDDLVADEDAAGLQR